MAKLTNKDWCDLMNRIHSGRSCLTLEAQKYDLSLDELIAMGDKAHTGGNAEREKEWNQTKRESSKRDKQIARPRKSCKKSKPTTDSPTIVSAPAPIIDTSFLGKMHQRMEKIEEELCSRRRRLDDADEILKNKKKDLESAKEALSEAEAAVEEAEKIRKGLKRKVEEKEKELNNLEIEIRKNMVYLVSPLYTGELPEYGIFISTTEMEGVLVQEVPVDYIPEDNIEGVFLFKEVSDYKVAKVFVGLVFMYEVEGENFELIVGDKRVDALIKMLI